MNSRNEKIEELERAGFEQALRLALFDGGLPKMMQVAIEWWQREKQRSWLLETIMREFQHRNEWLETSLAPTRATVAPPIATEEELARIVADGQGEMSSFANTVFIDVSIAIRYGVKPDEYKIVRPDNGIWFPGSLEEAEAEILSRMNSLLHRSPMPENIGSAGLGATEEVMQAAMIRLAEYRINPDFQKDWTPKFEEVFGELIWPSVKDLERYKVKGGQGEARNRALKEIERRFRNMKKHGRATRTKIVRKKQSKN